MNFITKWILEYFFLKEVRKMFGFLDGYKTIIGGIGLILGGLALIAKDVSEGDFSHIGEGWTMITLGLVALGIGGKVQKVIDKK